MITFVVPTIGRPSLAATLESIEAWPGDQIVIVAELDVLGELDAVRVSSLAGQASVLLLACTRGNDWGHTERNFATPHVRTPYVAHIDDDDVYASGSRLVMSRAIHDTPNRPIIFKMRYPNGLELWQSQVLRCGNVGTPMFLLPNDPEKMTGTWAPYVGGDFAFLEGCKWRFEDYVWRPEVVALLGHNT